MVAKKWKVDLDLCGNELLNGVFQNSHTAPTNPKNGQVYYDLEDSLFKMYQNGSWVSYTTPSDVAIALSDYYTKSEVDTKDQEVKDEIYGKIWSNVANPANGHFYTKLTNPQEGYALLFNESDGGGSQVFDKTANTLSYVGANLDEGHGADTGAVNIQIYSVDKTSKIGARLNTASNGIFYTNGKANASYTVDDEIVTKKITNSLASDIDDLQSQIDSFDPLPDQTGHIGDALFANGTTGEWSPLPVASTTTAGIIRLATSSEISTGTATNVAISAKDLADAVSDIDADLALKADKSTTYTKDEVDAKMVAAFHYKGNVARVGDLPVSGNVTGDVYNVTSTGANYAWDGENWDKLSETIDLTPFLTKTEASSTYETIANVDLIEADITALDGRVDDLEDAISGAVKKEVVIQSSALTSSGGVVTWNISHTLGEDVSITMKEIATGEEVIGSYIFGNNSIVVKMNIAENVPANTFKAIIIG